MDKYCNNTWQWVVQALGSDKDKGLKEIEIEERRKNYGSNKINLPIGKNIFYCIVKESLRWYIFFSLILGGILCFENYMILGISFILTLFLTIGIKSYITYKRERKVSYLQGLNNANVRVLRDGFDKLVRADELVIGDIVFFSKNTLISADLRIITSRDLKVLEKNLTGEEFVKEKFDSKIEGRIRNIAEMKNVLLRGSVVKSGEGAGVVISVGNSTELGKMLTILNYGSSKREDYLRRFEKKLSLATFLLSLIAMGLYFIFYTKEVSEVNLMYSLYGIFIMPVIIVLIGYISVLKRSVGEEISLVNPSVLNWINDAEIVFMDKIGAFTKEEMDVTTLFTDFEKVNLSDANYNKDINIKRLVDILLICNNSTYNINDDTGKGTLEEIAYLRFAALKGAYKSIVDNRNKRKFELPMDSDKRIVTVLTKSKRGIRANSRGNVDEILDKCTYIMINGIEKEMTSEDRERIRAIDYNLSIEGLTTEGVAYRSFSYEPSISENIESNLVFVGVIGLDNPLVENYKEKVDTLKENNIIPIIFTSSNKIAATTFGIKSGIIKSSNEVISGVELDSLSKEELIDVLGRVKIFSKVNMEIKSRIIALFSKDNYKVITTGENIGDLPSLSLATVGVTTGSAPESVKSLSDVYIEKNFLANLFKVADLGKRFKASLERYLNAFYMLALIQILLINTYRIYLGENIEPLAIVLITLTLGAPILILALNNEFSKLRIKDVMASVITISGTTLLSAYILGEEGISLVIFAFTMVGWTFINGKNIKSKGKVNLILNILQLILFGVVIYFIFNTYGSISLISKITLVIIGGIFLLIEWISKKWILL